MLQLVKYALPDIPYDAVARQKVDLIRDTQTHRISVTIMSGVQIAGGAASGAVAPENPLTMVRFIRLLENGETTMEWDPRALAQLTEREAAKALSGVPLTNGGIQGPTTLRQQVTLNFAHPLSIKPQETAYVPLDSTKPLQLEIEWAPDRKAALVDAANDRVFTFTNTLARVVQHHDPFATERPVFLPRVRRIDSQAIVGNMSDFPLEVRSKNRIRGLLLQGLSDGATAAVVTLVTFRGDKRDYIRRVSFDELHEQEQNDFGGATDQPGYLLLNFQQNGRLSQVFSPIQDDNPRLEMNVAQVAATSTVVRVYALELLQVPNFTKEITGAF